MKKLFAFLCAMFFVIPVFACANNEIDVNGTCVESKFELTTSSTGSYQFKISAAGTFYVDCGNGGNLQGTGASGKTITRSDTTEETYTCAWSSAAVQTIRFGGSVTQYGSNMWVAAVSFYVNDSNAAKITNLSGSIGSIFPILGQSSEMKPNFFRSFYHCTNITSLPSDLFSGINGNAIGLFQSTFSGCTKLESIPENLFSGVTGANLFLFYDTFSGCTALTTIPENLFRGVQGAAGSMFGNTFAGCTKLKSIPENLFAGVSGAKDSMFSTTFSYCSALTSIPENLFRGVRGAAPNLFGNTFVACRSLKSIPENLFQNVSGAANQMFRDTFSGCYNLTSIPANLFSGVAGMANQLFQRTFKGCTSLTFVPENLFSGVSEAANHMFYETFANCTNLTGYIPPSTFSGLIINNSPNADYMWNDIFSGTQLDTTCPSGTTEYTTGYQSTWDGKVSCRVATNQTCSVGEYLPKLYNSCTICPVNSICSGGTYSFNETLAQGIQSCVNGFSPTGSAVCYPHILHVGDDVIYVRSTKLTTPSLNIDMNQDGIADFFVNMTTTRTRINKDSTRYLHADYGDNHYYLCDDTTCP